MYWVSKWNSILFSSHILLLGKQASFYFLLLQLLMQANNKIVMGNAFLPDIKVWVIWPSYMQHNRSQMALDWCWMYVAWLNSPVLHFQDSSYWLNYSHIQDFSVNWMLFLYLESQVSVIPPSCTAEYKD